MTKASRALYSAIKIQEKYENLVKENSPEADKYKDFLAQALENVKASVPADLHQKADDFIKPKGEENVKEESAGGDNPDPKAADGDNPDPKAADGNQPELNDNNNDASKTESCVGLKVKSNKCTKGGQEVTKCMASNKVEMSNCVKYAETLNECSEIQDGKVGENTYEPMDCIGADSTIQAIPEAQ